MRRISRYLVVGMCSLYRLLTSQRSTRFPENYARQSWVNVIGTCSQKHAVDATYTVPHRRYQAALRALYAKHGAAAVFFEVGRVSSKGGHAHIQAVPVPLSLKDRVESAFQDEGRPHDIEFDVEEGGAPINTDGEGYFRVELPDGRRLVHRMRSGLPFSVQFGRYVSKLRVVNLLVTSVPF